MNDEFPGVERQPGDGHIVDTGEAFATRARIHQTYSAPAHDLCAWALERIQWRGDEVVLDAACGAGAYLDALRARVPGGQLVAADCALDLLDARGAGGAVAIAPRLRHMVSALPFANDTFDVVLAAHILDYVADIDAALSELHRVLRPDGAVMVVTHSNSHMAEFDVLYCHACALLGVPEDEVSASRPRRPFRVERAASLLSRHFFAVARYDLPSMLIFPEVAPAMRFLESLRPAREPSLPAGVTWPMLMRVMAELIAQVIDYFGALMVSKLSAVLVATDASDFAAPFAAWAGSKAHSGRFTLPA